MRSRPTEDYTPPPNPTKRMTHTDYLGAKYSTPTHRWISYGELAYLGQKDLMACPKELATTDPSGCSDVPHHRNP